MIKSIAELEIERISWESLREISGNATKIPHALQSLLKSTTPEEAERAYWQLENHVVVQGQLFESALYVVPVLIASLLEPRPKHVRISVLDLLFQILSGSPHSHEISLGNSELATACKDAAKAGLWVLYREWRDGEREAALDVLRLIEDQPIRLENFLRSA